MKNRQLTKLTLWFTNANKNLRRNCITMFKTQTMACLSHKVEVYDGQWWPCGIYNSEQACLEFRALSVSVTLNALDAHGSFTGSKLAAQGLCDQPLHASACAQATYQDNTKVHKRHHGPHHGSVCQEPYFTQLWFTFNMRPWPFTLCSHKTTAAANTQIM